MRRLLALLLAGVALAAAPAPAQAAVPRCDGVRATIVGTGGPDRLVGTSGRDVIVGRGGNDTIRARGGRDLVCGGDGADRIEGGPGRDRLLGGPDAVNHLDGERCVQGDRLDGGDGGDLLAPGRDPRRARIGCGALDQVRFRHGTGAVRVDLEQGVATGQGHDRIEVDQALEVVGSDGDDVLVGTGRDEAFDPRRGDDEVDAGNGRDRIVEGRAANGNDTYDVGDGRDTVITRRGHDGVRLGTDDDVLIALNPARMGVDGGNGADEISRYAAPDQERVSGGEGVDRLTVILKDSPGDQAVLDIPVGHLTVDAAVVVVDGFEHWVFVAERPILVHGSDQSETVEAPGLGDDDAALTAYLGDGDDTAIANTADDHVDGGDGHDHADLGVGDDTCVDVEDGPC